MRTIVLSLIAVAIVAVLALRLYHDGETGPQTPTTSQVSTTTTDSAGLDQQADDSGQADQAPSDAPPAATSALEQKQRQTEINSELVTGMTMDEIDEQIADTSESLYGGPDSLRERLTQVHTELADQYGEEEADFRLALIINAADWEMMKSLVANREAILGTSGLYDQVLLDTGITNGQISYEEIIALTSTGSVLPENMIYALASNGRIDLIEQLSQNNFVTNPNYEQPVLGRNAIGALISHASYFPDSYESTEAIGDAIDTLIGAGVVPIPSHGGLGPMDHALTNVSDRNFEARYTIVKKLLEHGVPFEQSHMELIASLPEGDNKDELQQLLLEHM